MPSLRRSFTVAQKVEVVDWHRDNGKNFSKTEREWGISRKQVRQWCSEYEKLIQMKKSASNMRKIHLGAKPKSEEMDQALYEYFDELRDSGISVSNRDLQAKSRELAGKMKIGDFRASDGWLARWKKRYHVSLSHGTNDVKTVPEDCREKLEDVCMTTQCIRQRGPHAVQHRQHQPDDGEVRPEDGDVRPDGGDVRPACHIHQSQEERQDCSG